MQIMFLSNKIKPNIIVDTHFFVNYLSENDGQILGSGNYTIVL